MSSVISNIVLLVSFSSLVKIDGIKRALIENIGNKLAAKGIKTHNITFEDSCIIFEVTDPVEALSIVIQLFGVKKVAIARRVRRNFASITAAIVDVGKMVVLPRQKFYVKVERTRLSRTHFVGRDIEFHAAGSLTRQLSSRGCRPAKRESEAEKIILSYIGNESAYVCLQFEQGIGGLPSGSLKEEISCGIYNGMSTISCLLALRSGFIPNVLILYANEQELMDNVKLFVQVIGFENLDTCALKIAPFVFPDYIAKRAEFLVREDVASAILTAICSKRLAIPLSAAIHPIWFIESITRKIVAEGKIPWFPLLLSSAFTDDLQSSLRTTDVSVGIDHNNQWRMTREMYQKYETLVDRISTTTIKKIKTINMSKIGPNYLHDIIDSA